MNLICSNCNEDYHLVGKSYERDNGKIDYWCTNCRSKKKPLSQKKSEKKQTEIKIKKEETKNTLHITCSSYNIKTLEDLISHSNIDTKIWEIDRFITNSWETTMSGKRSSTNKDQTYTNYQIKAWWKRKTPEIISLNNLQYYKPEYHNISIKKYKNEILHEISIFDHHFGKFAWECESGENFDLKIAKKRFIDAIISLCKFEIKPNRILFPLGNDILHINNESNTTYKGTQQDVDTRLTKIFEFAYNTIIDSIFTLSSIAPIDIIWVGSNHDLNTSWFLCHSIAQFFKETDRVTINYSPKVRKSYIWGDNGIFFDHGEIKPDKLVNILSTEFAKDWGVVKWRECHAGHLHKKQEISYTTADTFGSLIYRRIPSLTGTDAWHYKNGFIGSPKAAQSFIWDKHEGQIANYTHNIKG